ncbi:A disintegrin and metalloproteinase with thrombospondin motifs 3-like [Strongylocentrotus purpuratus]|uniref:Peptidase M12B domain-containing protein n=1 Tax=Strongylocentrotus purpuratus TaxID=7668 RepID=A0A7M7PLX2_STRPU|nr:A disintegrin and metalloproteinase with thrombospondin motifs 3-like [Strongylocentrotus purpuratus]
MKRGFKLSKEDLQLYTSNHHSIEDYDFTAPVYVDPKPIVNKRSVDSELVTPREREVKFNAFGQQYHARLQPNPWLLRQGLIVERVGSDGTITEEEISDRDCYYFAHLISHMGESAGALSTCNGLRGLISHDDTDVYITPLKDHHDSRYRRETQDEFNGEKAHIVYKRTSPPKYNEEPDLRDQGSWEGGNVSRDQGSWEGGNVSHPGPIFADKMAAGQEEGEHLQEGGQRYLEVFVVIDDEMVRVHQEDVMNYALAIMNMERFVLRVGANKMMGLLGRAAMGTVCSSTMSCGINEEDGLEAALTIAHELGHNLNLNHDPAYGCENGRNIMSSTKSIGANNFKWSSCSSKHLAEFLKSPDTDCLLDRPSLDHPDVDLIPIDQLAGAQYGRVEQCKKVFGADLVIGICPFERAHVTCGQVPCRIGSYCHYTPVVEGTPCGTNMWCYDGFCRSSIGGVPKPVDGNWGEWPVNYTQCSRTCGSGVMSRRRRCNRPGPRFGGKACEGTMYSMKTCNTEPCPGINSPDDFRHRECALTNTIILKTRYHEWSAYLDGTLYG